MVESEYSNQISFLVPVWDLVNHGEENHVYLRVRTRKPEWVFGVGGVVGGILERDP